MDFRVYDLLMDRPVVISDTKEYFVCFELSDYVIEMGSDTNNKPRGF